MQSYSQMGQDHFVLEYYKHLKNGFFVEIGAADGLVFSNTFLLEKDYEWQGICIEAGDEDYLKLSKNRRCATVHKAAYSQSGLTLEFVNRQCGLVSGLKDHYDFETFKDIPIMSVSKIETESLTDILDRLKAPNFIQYMSIDTEGSENEILKGTNFSKYTFGLLNIEHNHNVEKRAEQRSILERHGYKFLKQNDFDDYYVS